MLSSTSIDNQGDKGGIKCSNCQGIVAGEPTVSKGSSAVASALPIKVTSRSSGKYSIQ